MKFSQDIVVTFEGEIYDSTLSPEDIIRSIKMSFSHWWNNNPNWPYGEPSDICKRGKVDQIIINHSSGINTVISISSSSKGSKSPS